MLALADIELEPGDKATAKDVYDQIALKFRDAALAREEKAEKIVAFQEKKMTVLRNDAHKALQYAEQMQAERDVLIENFHTDDCPVERGFDAPDWCSPEVQCGDWTCDFGVEDCWRKWAAQEAANKAGEEV